METAFQARIPWVILLALSAAAVAWLCRASSFRASLSSRTARPLERFSLLAVTVPVALGLILASSGRRARSESAGAIDLRTLVKPELVLPLIPDVEPTADRAFVATKIADAVRSAKPGSIGNAGFLARLKTDAAEASGFESFRTRVDAAAHRSPPAQTVALLTRASFDALKPKLIVRTPREFRLGLFLWCGLAMAAFWLVHIFWRLTGFEGDEALLPSVQFIAGVGLIVLTGLRDPLRDQMLVTEAAAGIVAGCAALAVLSRIDWQRRAARLSFTPAVCAFALSAALILFGSGPGSSDAKVNLGPFQPAEAIKLLLVFSFAGYFGSRWMYLRQLHETRDKLAVLRRGRAPRLEDLAPVAICAGVALAFFFLQKDLGPALLVSCVFLCLFAVARKRVAAALCGAALILGGLTAGYLLGVPHTVVDRVDMFLHPWGNSARGGVQVAQALWSAASGGVFGSGPGLGDPELAPAAHTDLILAAAGEQTGAIGMAGLFLVYAALIFSGMRIASRAASAFHAFLAAGITLLIAWSVLLIAAGTFGLFPLSGVVAPFLSYGRSAMLANFAAIGVLVSVSAREKRPRGDMGPFARGLKIAGVTVAILGACVVTRVVLLQTLMAKETVTAGALVLQQDGVRRYEYNPRFAILLRRLGRGAVYDRNGLPLATDSCAEIVRLRYQLRAAGASTVCPEDGGRIYPAGPAAFYLVGDARTRTNWGAGNSSYIERDEQTRLRGYTVSTVDANGAPQTQRNYGPLVDLLPLRNLPDSAVAETFRREHSVASSIDAGLTLDAARVLNSAIARSGSGKGAIVVMDAETGEVLASVSGPQPPEHTPEATPDQLLDRARYGLYPPGSSFKLVTAAAGLRKDPACAESTFQCSRLEGGRTGAMVRRALIRDDAQDTEPHGEINMQRALVVSCNAWFAAFAVGRVGSNELFRTAAQLGISVARPATAEQLNHLLPQAAYGQGQVVASPLQMARVAAMIANGGSVPPVRWRAGENAEEKRIRILEAPEAQVLGSAMRMAVTEGTGKLALRAPVPVAGKTGTAETGGAASHAWFVGYAPWGPTKGRRIAFAILIENGGYGGTAAAPVAAEVVRAAVERHLIER